MNDKVSCVPNSTRSIRTLSVMLTYRCTAQCQDCGTFSSPHDKNRIDAKDAINAISEAKELGFYNVVFTGGEATLEFENLILCIRHAVSLGFPTRLVTNGHWAAEPSGTLAALVDAGLNEINFSTGDQHARFVPLEVVLRGCQASIEQELPTSLMLEVRDGGKISRAVLDEFIQDRYSKLGKSKLFSIVESPWMPVRASSIGYNHEMAATKQNLSSKRGCDSVLQTYVVQGNGVIASCCGLGMRKIKELQHGNVCDSRALEQAVGDAESDVMKLALKIMGPEKILAWAAGHDKSIEWEGRYAHRCHACVSVYDDERVATVFKAKWMELLPDLIYSKFMDDVGVPSLFSDGVNSH